jgi:hypothetical protein
MPPGMRAREGERVLHHNLVLEREYGFMRLTWSRYIISLAGNIPNSNFLLILSLYFLLNCLSYCFSPPQSFLESDTMDYLLAADSFVKTGSFSSEHRLPIYPFFLAAVLIVTTQVGAATVALHALLLLATSIVAARIATMLNPRAGLPTLILVCFNATALFYVQQILPDTLFTFFLMLHIYFLLQAMKASSTRAAVISGMFAGILALIRGNGQYILWLMPLAMSMCLLIRHRGLHLPRVVKLASLLLISAILITSPWLLFNWRNGNGISFVTSAYRNLTVHDNIISAVALGKGIQKAEAREIVYDLVRRQLGIEEASWEGFTVEDIHLVVASRAFDILLEDSLGDLSRAVIKAVIKFFLVNDGQTWAAFWQLSADERLDPDAWQRYSLSATLKTDVPDPVTTYASHALTIAFVLFVRIMDILGIIFLVRQKRYDLLVIFGAYITLFALSAAFIGYSRYRLPVDPLLMILASWGLVYRFSWTKG